MHEQAREGRDCARRRSIKEPKPLGLANASPVRDEHIANLEQHDPQRWRRTEFPFILSICYKLLVPYRKQVIYPSH